jgi:hypothetical protein
MATLYYRGMVDENGRPKLGRSARLLGVRFNRDIDIQKMPQGWLDRQGYLKSEVERTDSGQWVDVALRNAKGMSVSLSINSLPKHRKPPQFGGTGRDPLWQIDDSKITGDLEAIQNSTTHVSIVPKATMLLEK